MCAPPPTNHDYMKEEGDDVTELGWGDLSLVQELNAVVKVSDSYVEMSASWVTNSL